MASNNPQHAQAQNSPQRSQHNPQRSQVQWPGPPGVRLSEPRQHATAPTQLPFYLPPPQPLPIISSTFSDNQDPRRISATNNPHGYQGYQGYYPFQGTVPPPPFPQYQPQLGYLPYRAQPEFNVTSFPFIPLQTTIFPPPVLHPLPSPYPVSTPYLNNTGPNVQQPVQNYRATRISKVQPRKHESDTSRHRNQAPSHTQVEPTADDNVDILEPKNPDPSTPILQRISSGRFHDDERRMYAKELIPLLKQELASEVSQSSNLANTIFPTDSLPFPVDDNLLLHLAYHGIWSIEGAHFIRKPESYSEVALADWLNILGRTIGMVYDKKRVRMWSANTRNLPPIGTNTIRKPDIILLDRDVFSKPSRIHWSSIRAFGEVTAQESFPTRMTDTVNEKSYLLFLTQDNRRFVPALKFDGNNNFSLTVTDRQGQIRMPAMSLSVSGKDCALILLRILAALMYGSLLDVGIDPSMECDEKGNVMTIFVNKKEFTVFRRIYALQALVGRGTKVWIVTREDRYYILKDSWVQSGRVESEINFLKLMAQHPALTGRIPKLIEGEDLQIGRYADSTEWYRIDIGQIDQHRIHRRHVTEPIGSPLIKFKSRVECLSAIVDVLQGM
jgi:Fungal protein kinase